MRSGKDSFFCGQQGGLVPQIESLELRAMLWNALGVPDGFYGDIFLEPSADVFADDVSVVEENNTTEPLPVIPFDHSVSPIKECLGLPPELCLPGDLDGSGGVDFSDFLLLSENFGLEDAELQDGDLDGDQVVSFADFLILASSFGETA